MDTNDRQAIEGLFQKLGTLERDMPQRDPEAERFINDQVGRNPGSPYYMAQTIVMQQMALEKAAANSRHALAGGGTRATPARRAAGRWRGFLSRMFGGGDQSRQPRRLHGRTGRGRRPLGRPEPLRPPGQGQPGMMGGRGGGGFLAGAAQTAMGVAGGVLLGNAIAGMFDGNEAHAAEAPAPRRAAGRRDGRRGGLLRRRRRVSTKKSEPPAGSCKTFTNSRRDPS